MAKKSRFHLVGSGGDGEGPPTDEQHDGAPPVKDQRAGEFMTKEEFGRRLYRAMLGKGMSQSDLHRATGLTRDSISGYVRGRTLPNPINLAKLADAVGVEPESLLPNYVMSAIREDDATLEMKMSAGDSTKALLRVNRVVSPETASRVIQILNEDKTTN